MVPLQRVIQPVIRAFTVLHRHNEQALKFMVKYFSITLTRLSVAAGRSPRFLG